MSDINTTGGLGATGSETLGAGDTTGTQGAKGQAKQAIGQASQALKQEAQTFASAAQDKVRAETQKHTQTAVKTLGDFANAIRRAGDELAQNDQSPAARLIGQAADSLEGFSRNLADKEPEDLLNTVRDFGRRSPWAFIGGAVLVGMALGRFIRASDQASYETQSFTQGAGGAYPMATAYSASGGSEDLASTYAVGAEAGDVTTSAFDEADADTAEFGTSTSLGGATDLSATPMTDDAALSGSTVDEDTSVLGIEDDGSTTSPADTDADASRRRLDPGV